MNEDGGSIFGLPLGADEKIEAPKHYFEITFDGEIITRGIETGRHDTPNFIKQFQYDLLQTLFSDRKDSRGVTTKGYDDALLLVTQAIDKIMTARRNHSRGSCDFQTT
jgi:DNA polymerase elongation subunit (family B)